MLRKCIFLAVTAIATFDSATAVFAQEGSVKFTVHSARSGRWSEPGTWAEGKVPGAGDNVQVRVGHVVSYDANADRAVRVLHVAGTLEFARDRSTRLDVGLIKIQSGAECTEDGFDCDAHAADDNEADKPGTTVPALLIGTRPNLQYFLMDGLAVHHAAYGVYHPDYDAHVYRNIYLHRVDAEPINRGHDDESIQYGTFTYENLTIESSRIGRDPLIQMACTSPLSGQAGHFRNVTIKNSDSRQAKVVDWEITLDAGLNSPVVAQTTDKAGNQEKVNHEFRLK